MASATPPSLASFATLPIFSVSSAVPDELDFAKMVPTSSPAKMRLSTPSDLPFAMMPVMPLEEAARIASSLDCRPPLPAPPPKSSCHTFSSNPWTSGIAFLSAPSRPSTVERTTSASAFMPDATREESTSLSPKARPPLCRSSSSVATASFSFTTGMTCMESSRSKVPSIFPNRSESVKSFWVSSTCATHLPLFAKNELYCSISRLCPTAALAC